MTICFFFSLRILYRFNHNNNIMAYKCTRGLDNITGSKCVILYGYLRSSFNCNNILKHVSFVVVNEQMASLEKILKRPAKKVEKHRLTELAYTVKNEIVQYSSHINTYYYNAKPYTHVFARIRRIINHICSRRLRQKLLAIRMVSIYIHKLGVNYTSNRVISITSHM